MGVVVLWLGVVELELELGWDWCAGGGKGE